MNKVEKALLGRQVQKGKIKAASLGLEVEAAEPKTEKKPKTVEEPKAEKTSKIFAWGKKNDGKKEI